MHRAGRLLKTPLPSPSIRRLTESAADVAATADAQVSPAAVPDRAEAVLQTVDASEPPLIVNSLPQAEDDQAISHYLVLVLGVSARIADLPPTIEADSEVVEMVAAPPSARSLQLGSADPRTELPRPPFRSDAPVKQGPRLATVPAEIDSLILLDALFASDSWV
jgi:hypothetical protein